MQIEKNVDLKLYNTLQVPVKAKYFVVIKQESDILELMQTDLWKIEKHCILNGGSNILFTCDLQITKNIKESELSGYNENILSNRKEKVIKKENELILKVKI